MPTRSSLLSMDLKLSMSLSHRRSCCARQYASHLRCGGRGGQRVGACGLAEKPAGGAFLWHASEISGGIRAEPGQPKLARINPYLIALPQPSKSYSYLLLANPFPLAPPPHSPEH